MKNFVCNQYGEKTRYFKHRKYQNVFAFSSIYAEYTHKLTF